MSIFVGSTMTYVKDVKSKYRDIEPHCWSNIISGYYEKELDDKVILFTDYEKRIDEIRDDINDAIFEIERHDTLEALGKLEILVEKLNY